MSTLEFVSLGTGRAVTPGAAVAAAQVAALESYGRRRSGGRGGRRVKVLVAEPIAAEGVELLRDQPRGR